MISVYNKDRIGNIRNAERRGDVSFSLTASSSQAIFRRQARISELWDLVSMKPMRTLLFLRFVR
jgi:hypothetical protein